MLLLHGALGSAQQLVPLAQLLPNTLQPTIFEFAGHGQTPPQGNFSIDLFADQLLKHLDLQGIDSTDIFGYSMGGYVALRLAQLHPLRINRVFTLGTKIFWTPEAAAEASKLLNPTKIAEKVPAFAQMLAARHQTLNWQTVMQQTANLMADLGTNNLLTQTALQSISNKISIGIGDRDNTLTIAEAEQAYRCLPNAQLMVLPNTYHPFEKINLKQLSNYLVDFFD